jgi:polyketide synthase 12/myxalamid-type polyketide synthase MxaB
MLTRHRALDFFVIFSSGVALLGSPGQANHVAASTFLDSLAHHRRAQGLPALSINWGAWSEVGSALKQRVEESITQRGGLYISPQEGIEVFEHVMRRANSAVGTRHPQVGIVRVDWAKHLEQWAGTEPPPIYREISAQVAPQQRKAASRANQEARGRDETSEQGVGNANDMMQRLSEAARTERHNIMLDYVRLQALRVLTLDATYPLDRRQKLQEVGLDSLMAVELRNRIGSGLTLKRKLPATLLFDYPTIEALTGYLLQELAFGQTSEAQAPAAHDKTAHDKTGQDQAGQAKSAEATLAELEQLSDEEAEALLFDELRNTQEGNHL